VYLLDDVAAYAAKLYREEGYSFLNAVSAALNAYHFRGAERREMFRAVCRILGRRGGSVAVKHKAQAGQMKLDFKPE
jgi:hypothetical protein